MFFFKMFSLTTTSINKHKKNGIEGGKCRKTSTRGSARPVFCIALLPDETLVTSAQPVLGAGTGTTPESVGKVMKEQSWQHD